MKYIIKFKKEGKIRFISHLDLQKVFLRLFRIIGVKPKYSNGFNPHPKLSFALPLSLGFSSEAEYLELESESDKLLSQAQILDMLKEYLPDGLTIVYIKQKPDILNKKLASYIDSTRYLIECQSIKDSKEQIKAFSNQDIIIFEKYSRKSGKTKDINIKPLIHELKVVQENHNNIMLSALLHAGNDSVLNPNVLLESFYSFVNEDVEINNSTVTRKSVYCRINKEIMDVDDIFSLK